MAVQTPCMMPLAFSITNLDKKAKVRYKHLSPQDQMKVVLCVLCKNRLKSLKVRASVGVPCGPMKAAPRAVKVSSQIVNKLCHLAAFQCQVFVFIQLEKAGKAQWDDMICEQFYACGVKNIKGACQQVIDGDNAFKFLYDVVEGEDGLEHVLKPSFTGSSQHVLLLPVLILLW
jgi:hypothetical protein